MHLAMIEYIVKSFVCPDIRSQSDADLIDETLRNAPEIDSCEVDVPARTVTVRYVEGMNTSDLFKHLADAGFPAEEE